MNQYTDLPVTPTEHRDEHDFMPKPKWVFINDLAQLVVAGFIESEFFPKVVDDANTFAQECVDHFYETHYPYFSHFVRETLRWKNAGPLVIANCGPFEYTVAHVEADKYIARVYVAGKITPLSEGLLHDMYACCEGHKRQMGKSIFNIRP